MATVGTFTLIKNELPWIRAHLLSWLPHVDQMVFFDGNSTDGTLDVIEEFRTSGKIVLERNRDPKNLQDDYVRMFNDCLRTLKTDYAIFAHPDMILDSPGCIRYLGDHHAYFSRMRSFAGEPCGQLYEIIRGRGARWKNIYRLKNPDLGLHYFGHYGAKNEDCYFSKITGLDHDFYGQQMEKYPYSVGDSGIRILHFSDVRDRQRRWGRMKECLLNCGFSDKDAEEITKNHPRVTLKGNGKVEFAPAEYPKIFKEIEAERLLKQEGLLNDSAKDSPEKTEWGV